MSHTFLLWVLRQWWKIVIPAGLLLAAIAAGVLMYVHTPQYEATALLMIEDVTPFIAFRAGVAGGDSSRYVQTQLELLRSPVVLGPVLAHQGIASLSELVDASDRVAFLREHMSVKSVGQSELYNVSYRSPSPEAAANVVNAVIAEYMTINYNDEAARSQHVVGILEEERRRRGLEVERLRKRLVEMAKEVTGRDPFAGNEVTNFNRALTPVGAIFQQLTEIDVEREVLTAELKSLTAAPGLAEVSMESSGLLDLHVENQEEIRARRSEIMDIALQMEQIKNRAIRLEKKPQLEKNPAYATLTAELTQRKQDLEEAKVKLRDMIRIQLKDNHERERDQQTAMIKKNLEHLETRRELLTKRFDMQVQKLQSGSAKSVELEFARAELAREESVFELIASRKLALQTELRAPLRVKLRQKAETPTVPVESVPYKLLLLVCTGSFVAPFGSVLLRELTVRRVSDVEQLAQESGLRVLGEVVALPVRNVAVSPRQVSGRLRRDGYIYAESINCLRTNLALTDGWRDTKVLAVTSASSGEGKTSIAVSLAMSIAAVADQPTLIIDGDMRSPTVATMLKSKSQPGLFEALSKECALEDAIHRVGEDDLYVIPGGRATRSTHSVVGITEVRQLLDQLRARFSTIIIDTPPILGASEALVLAKLADSVLFCALCDTSKAKQVRLAVDRLAHAQVNIAGAVLSGTPIRRYECVYGYYANRVEAGE